MNNNLIRILILFFLILSLSSPRAQAAGTSSITITVTIAEVEMVEATVEFRPRVIRRTNRNIQCYIELPNPYKVEDIDVNTVALTEVNGTVIDPPLKIVGRPMIGDYDKDGIPDLRVWFDIRYISPLLKDGVNDLTVTGKLVAGKTFKGTGTIEVIER